MKKEINFEDAINRLGDITDKLENGSLPLDESLQLFEEGIKLSRFCEKKLSDTEKKVLILTQDEMGDEYDEPATAELAAPQPVKKQKKQSATEVETESNFLF